MTTTRPACLYAAGSTAADGSFRHPRFTGDGYLSPCRSSDARHPEHDARYDPTHVEPLYGDARRGPGDFWSALRQNRATANSTCGRNGFRHCVSGSSLVFNCTGLCRFPSTSSSGRVGHAGGDVRDGSRRLCQPS